MKNLKYHPVISMYSGKDMKKKSGKILLCMLVFGLLIPVVTAYRPNGEVMDQSTPLGTDSWICGMNNNYIAQSFKPTLPVLSRIELGLFKEENITGTFTISIRQRLNGEDLVTKNVSMEEVPWLVYGDWVSIDFEDIDVTPNKRYYIVFTSYGSRNVFWIMSNMNPYHRGRPWTLGGSLPFWIPCFLTVTKIPDMSFRTYGYQ
jgi:hypothetical protein